MIMYVCMHQHTHTHTYTHVHTYTHTHTHKYPYMYTHARTHACTHTSGETVGLNCLCSSMMILKQTSPFSSFSVSSNENITDRVDCMKQARQQNHLITQNCTQRTLETLELSDLRYYIVPDALSSYSLNNNLCCAVIMQYALIHNTMCLWVHNIATRDVTFTYCLRWSVDGNLWINSSTSFLRS